MTLSDQVCSLPLAQRLKELGVRQESFLVWSGDDHSGMIVRTFDDRFRYPDAETVSAFTVAELGEMLPAMCIEGEHRVAGDWVIDAFRATTEADARAKMLIYLLENGIITI